MRGGATPRTNRPHVLFAILDWGMGHATRTWPLILATRQLGAEVTIATRGTAAAWIEARMAEWDRHNPEAPAPWRRIDKPGVTIRYGAGRDTRFRIAAQLPGYLVATSRERRWVRQAIPQRGITHVFSDNCYGCTAAASGVSSVLLSHQLRLPVPLALQPLVRWQVRRWAHAFSAVWVPDLPGSPLAGRLSQPLSEHTEFVGPLSRFLGTVDPAPTPQDAPVLLGLVSGPEPQRSKLEEDLRTQFLRDGRPALILSGQPSGGQRRDRNVLTLHDADDLQFQQAVRNAGHIVCRSGYSTLMDLAVLGRTATLVPTLGQPEQEYLARFWHREHGWPTLHPNDVAGHPLGEREGQPISIELAVPTDLMRRWLFPSPPTEPPPAP